MMMKKSVFFLFFVLLLSVINVMANPRILIVSSYDKAYSWTEDLVNAIEAVLDKADVEQRYFYMDTRLRDDENWKSKTGKLTLDILESWQPDVVIACDDNAQQYFVREIPVDTNVQIVFCGVNKEPKVYGFPNERTTGIREIPFPVESLEAVSQIIPNLRKVCFIGDDTSSSEGHIDYLKRLDMGRFESIGYYKFSSLENLLLGMKNLSKICDVFYFIRTQGFKDRNGVKYSSLQSMRQILEATDVPVMGLSDYIVEDGALFGIVPDPNFQGTLAAQMALQLVSGEKRASDIPIVSFEADFSDLKDGKSYLNLNTIIEKGYSVPLSLINDTDVVISSVKREDEIVLAYYTLISGRILQSVADYLRSVAASPFTVDGDWEAIKKIYQNQGIDYPGIFLYILPNGDYYTDIRNFTSTNLSDRVYFKTLEADEEVLGYPVISRSTGKKSAVFAVPVKKENEITGFTGMSLYMEEINTSINTIMKLTPEVFLLAVDQTGTVMMTNHEQVLFEKADDIVTCECGPFIEKLNQNDSGKIAFKDHYGDYFGIYTTENTTGWKFILAKRIADAGKNTELNEWVDRTSTLSEEVVERINGLEDQFVTTSKTFADSTQLPEDIRGLLDALYDRVSDVYDIAFVNTDGLMEVVVPEIFRDFEGADIAGQEQVQRIARTYNPVVSHLIMTEEGIHGIDMEWPVFNRRGMFMGSISMLIEPEVFFEDIFTEILTDPEFDVRIVQNDGTILYAENLEEIGKNLFQDEGFSDYIEHPELAKAIVQEKDGSEEYIVLSTEADTAVREIVIWNSVFFHGTEWKLILTGQL